MNVVIVGLGLIGRNIREVLAKKGYQVKTISRKNADINIDLLKPINTEVLKKELNYPIDVIIFTAFKIPQSVEEDNVSILKANIEIVINFISICRIALPKQIINLSSIAVYKNLTGTITENSELEPSFNWNCYYGLSKLNAEQMLSNFGNKENIKVAHLRISQLLDENNSDSLQKSFVDELALSNSITLFAKGTRESNFIYNNFLAEFIIDKVITKKIEGTYNVGQIQQPYIEFAKDFVLKYGNKKTKVILEDKGNYSKINFDCSKIFDVLN